MRIKMTLAQAKALGIVYCRNCPHPWNNHFDFGKKPCAHCSCKQYKREIRLPIVDDALSAK